MAVFDRRLRFAHIRQLVNSDRKAPLNKITARFNETEDVKVSARTVRRRLKFSGYGKVVYKKKVVVKVGNRRKWVDWCWGKRWRTEDNL